MAFFDKLKQAGGMVADAATEAIADAADVANEKVAQAKDKMSRVNDMEITLTQGQLEVLKSEGSVNVEYQLFNVKLSVEV